jgi:hypothetical protein
MTTPSSEINKIEDILSFKAFVMCKRGPPPYFFCKIDILWIVPFLQNRGGINSRLIQYEHD